ncbi:MAG: hypothetical protein V1765_02625 [bacterium]
MGFGSWFLSSSSAKPKGKPSFNLNKTHSKKSFKEAIKQPFSYFDRRKAKELDEEIRSDFKTPRGISQRKYLKEAGEKQGIKFKRKLKARVFTSYQLTNPLLEERRRRRNIYEIQKARSKGKKWDFSYEGPQFANSPKSDEVQTTASRLGAEAGRAAPRPSSKDVDRSVWQR